MRKRTGGSLQRLHSDVKDRGRGQRKGRRAEFILPKVRSEWIERRQFERCIAGSPESNHATHSQVCRVAADVVFRGERNMPRCQQSEGEMFPHWDGSHHWPSLIRSLSALDYPEESFQTEEKLPGLHYSRLTDQDEALTNFSQRGDKSARVRTRPWPINKAKSRSLTALRELECASEFTSAH
jgi:hypothetical protein